LLDAVWGTDRFVTPRSVDVYVSPAARKKSNPIPRIRALEDRSRRVANLLKTRAVNLFWKTRRCVLVFLIALLLPVDF